MRFFVGAEASVGARGWDLQKLRDFGDGSGVVARKDVGFETFEILKSLDGVRAEGFSEVEARDFFSVAGKTARGREVFAIFGATERVMAGIEMSREAGARRVGDGGVEFFGVRKTGAEFLEEGARKWVKGRGGKMLKDFALPRT